MSIERVRLAVVLEDDTEHEITIGNPSLIAWDRTRVKRNWPKTSEAPIIWMTFIAWHHLKATGVVSCEYPEFEERVCVAVGDPAPTSNEGEEPELEDPTSPAAESV